MDHHYKYVLDYAVACVNELKAHGIKPPFPGMGEICPEFYNAILAPISGHTYEEAWGGPNGTPLPEAKEKLKKLNVYEY